MSAPLFRSSFSAADLALATRELDNGDKQVLAQLVNAGTAVDQPHDIGCYLYFPNQEQAQHAATALGADGFTAEVRFGAHNSGWLAFGRRSIVPHPANIVVLRKRLTKLAQSLGGEFDGWETAIVRGKDDTGDKAVELSGEDRARLVENFTPPVFAPEQVERFARVITGRKTGTLTNIKVTVAGAGDLINGAVFRFAGGLTADGVVVPWSALVKTVRDPASIATTDAGFQRLADARKDPRSWDYWRRELEFMSNAYMALVPRPKVMRLPRYHALAKGSPRSYMWLEDPSGLPASQWSPQRFAEAAYAMGAFSGGLVGNHTALDAPFLTISPASARMHNYLPTISHLDLSPACMFADDIAGATVVSNWTHAGVGPLGEDLAALTLEPVLRGLVPATGLDAFEASLITRFTAGARDSGWHGDERTIRGAYAAAAVIGYGGPDLLKRAQAGEPIPTAVITKVRALESAHR